LPTLFILIREDALPNKQNTVTISLKKYAQLITDQRTLRCLYAAGVDNWDGYSEAIGEDEEEE
jgi:hypothetical protein